MATVLSLRVTVTSLPSDVNEDQIFMVFTGGAFFGFFMGVLA